MAVERITFDFPGLLTLNQVSQQASASYKRTLKKVRMSTLGINPTGADCTVQLRLAESAQGTDYTLPAGLKFAENNGGDVEIVADTVTDFIVTAIGNAADLKVEAEFEVAVSAVGGSTTDLGLGTLGQLKRFILNSGIVAETTYDEALTFLGKGVAAAIDKFTNRTLKRGTSITEDFRGGTDLLLLARFPVESVTSVGLKTSGESSFTTQTSIVDTTALESGVLLLVSTVGTERDQLRVTYDGGYWYDTTDDDSGTQPTGSALLPHDIKMAWLLQCQHIWAKRDALGIQHVESPELRTTLTNLDLIPQVKMMLEPYRRLIL